MKCTLCPVACGADREETAGYCGVKKLNIAKYYLHPYEEPCISFRKGSGTIFFTGCNLKCVFCQNYELSRAKRGKDITVPELVEIMKELEETGADNISFVTPSHVVPYLAEALALYKPKIPVVYNSHGYEKVETLRLIDPYIDIYLPDLKFKSSALSLRYTGKADYFDVASRALPFMAQKPLVLTKEGKMLSGCIVRHLILPMGAGDSVSLLKWIRQNLPDSIYLSLMSQYTPFGEIERYPELNRRITKREYKTVLDALYALEFPNVYLQDPSSAQEKYIPAWDY